MSFATLPERRARTMLSPVMGPSLVLRRLRLRLFRALLPAVAALAALTPAASALAQDADGAWFDQPPQQEPTEPQAAPDPYYGEPAPSEPAQAAPAPTEVPDSDPSALTTFRPALDPYGAWVNDSSYGTVWVPNRAVVGEDFAPYVSRGHWALTADDDWIWESDYPFGWAVFHYGRWVWIAGHGWAWVPGRTYANAWVVWRTPYAGYDYIGWAPMPPTWGFYNGFAFGVWYSPPLPYVFCPSRYAFDYRVHYHIVRDRVLVRDIAAHSRVYPTPYHAPAAPSVRSAAAPGVRPPAMTTSAVPRGPSTMAARIPPSAVPAARTLPSTSALRLSGSHIASSSYGRPSPSSSTARIYSSSSSMSPSARRSFTSDPARRVTPSSPWPTSSREYSSSPTRLAPPSASPSRGFSTPLRAAPSRSFSTPVRPAPSFSAPVRAAPSHSYSAPSVRPFTSSPSHFSGGGLRMHSGGGGGFRRR